jgi:hypothetical protein
LIVILPLLVVIGILAWMLRPRKGLSNSSRIAIITTIVLAAIAAVAALTSQLLHNANGTVEVSEIANICFIVGIGLVVVYILASIGFVIARKGDIAKGIGFGICIAIFISIIELGLLEWLGGV